MRRRLLLRGSSKGFESSLTKTQEPEIMRVAKTTQIHHSDENMETLRMFAKYGFEKVRGGGYCNHEVTDEFRARVALHLTCVSGADDTNREIYECLSALTERPIEVDTTPQTL